MCDVPLQMRLINVFFVFILIYFLVCASVSVCVSVSLLLLLFFATRISLRCDEFGAACYCCLFTGTVVDLFYVARFRLRCHWICAHTIEITFPMPLISQFCVCVCVCSCIVTYKSEILMQSFFCFFSFSSSSVWVHFSVQQLIYCQSCCFNQLSGNICFFFFFFSYGVIECNFNIVFSKKLFWFSFFSASFGTIRFTWIRDTIKNQQVTEIQNLIYYFWSEIYKLSFIREIVQQFFSSFLLCLSLFSSLNVQFFIALCLIIYQRVNRSMSKLELFHHYAFFSLSVSLSLCEFNFSKEFFCL